MKEEDTAYLKHILDAIVRIEEYTARIEYKDFMENHLIQDGVIRQIEIIGEAAKMVSNEIREKHLDIPWKDMAGMRDKLIHDYLGVDMDALWGTVENDIPALKSKLKDLIAKREKI